MLSSLYDKIIYCLIAFGVAAFLIFGIFPNIFKSEWSGSSSIQSQWDGGTNNAPIAAQINGSSLGLKFPALTGRVVDGAQLIDAALEDRITSKLEAFEKKSSDQIVVVTIPSLKNENLEEYSNLLFRHWKLGQAQEDNGVLLLISKNDRKLRIEVGYGLEGVLTDAASKIIIDNVIVPEFKKGNFGTGINDGVDMIINVLSGDMAELESRAKRNTPTKNQDVNIGEVIFFTIWVILFFGPIGGVFLASIFGEKIKKGHYRWLGIDFKTGGRSGRSSAVGWTASGGSGRSSGGGLSGGGGSSGGGGASGGW